ncbi:response regulator transcription factor [Candidatus Dojkabacteria bacterium]|nr:response regulator transcription factor [Candidatus Dojkabacteria bacterium]
MKIALLEDSKKIGYIVFKAFERENIDVELFEGLSDAAKIIPSQFSAYIVDYNLKDGDGIEFIKKVRDRHEKTPILMLTVRDSIEDKLQCFEAGADDYMTKPFELAELVVRIKVLINRNSEISNKIEIINGIQFDFENKSINYQGEKIPFSKREYQLIEFLLHHKGRLVEKDNIIDSLWIDSEEKDPNIVNVYINRIRMKLKTVGAKDFIETVRGFGYMVK